LTEFFRYFFRVLHEASSSWLNICTTFNNTLYLRSNTYWIHLVRCPSVKKRNHVRQICLEGKNFMEDSPQLQVPDIVFCNAVDPCVLFKTLQKTNRMRKASRIRCHRCWIFSWAMSYICANDEYRFQFSFTDFSLVYRLRLRADTSKVTAHERIQYPTCIIIDTGTAVRTIPYPYLKVVPDAIVIII
jgi:hypothetical protein